MPGWGFRADIWNSNSEFPVIHQNGTLEGVANAQLVIFEKVKICLNRKAFIFLFWLTTMTISPTHLLGHLHPARCSSFFCEVEPDIHFTWRCCQVVGLSLTFRCYTNGYCPWHMSLRYPYLGFKEHTSFFCSPPAPVLLHSSGRVTPTLSLEWRNLICETLWAWEKTLCVDSRPLQTNTLGWSGIPGAD